MSRQTKKRDFPKRTHAAIHRRDPGSGFPQGTWIVPTFLGLASIAAYANVFSAPFIFDDKVSILQNPRIRSLWPIWPALWPPPQMAVSGRPVVSLSFALNYALGGFDVWGYHAFNLLVHFVNTLLVWAIVRRTLAADADLTRTEIRIEWLAGAVALLWSVHPLLSESVTYIMQRTELLAGLFLLLTVYAVSRSAEFPASRRWPAFAIFFCALGMGCKEVMAAAPLLALTYDRIFLAGSFGELFRRRRRLHAGLFSTWFILGALLATGPRTLSSGLTFSTVRPWDYLLTQAGVIVHYLRLTLFPYPLCLDYSDWPVARSLIAVLPECLVILALLGLTAWALMRAPKFGFLGVWFFLILAPSSSIVPIVTEPAAERRMYLPLLSVVILAVLAVNRIAAAWSQEPSVRRAKAVLLIVTAAALITATSRRNESYATETTAWADVLAKRPRNARALNNLGAELARQGQTGEALPLFERALELNPNYPEAHNNLGGVYYNLGRMADATQQFSEAVRLKPDYEEAHLNLGLALHNRGRLDEAMAQYRQALQLNPGDAEAHNHLGAALLSRGHAAEAIEHFRDALRIRPGYPEAQQNLDRALSGSLK